MANSLGDFYIQVQVASQYNGYLWNGLANYFIRLFDDGTIAWSQNHNNSSRDLGWPAGTPGKTRYVVFSVPSIEAFNLFSGKQISFNQVLYYTLAGDKTYDVTFSVDDFAQYGGSALVNTIEPVDLNIGCEDVTGYQTVYSRTATLLEFKNDCVNIPDGQAAITLLVKRVGDGQILAIQRNFDFRISDHSFSFFDHWNNNPFGDLGDFIIYGYRVKSAAGFTSGTIQVLETWSYAPGMQQSAFNIDRGSIQLSDGKTSGFLKVEQWSRTSIIEGLPKYFDGSISVVCNFADLPECNDGVYEGEPESDEIYIQNNDFSTTINESIEIHITDGEGLTQELTKIDEPTQPPEPPPEQNCDCQVYQAKLIYEGICYLQKTIDVRMSQLMVAFNANQKQLIQALVEGLKPLVTTEEQPRGIADVLAEKEFDPIFLVDTNECFYKKTMPPDGDAWIGDMP